VPPRRSGVKLEPPQPRSGEEERAWRRQAAADDREWGKPAGLWVAVDEASAGVLASRGSVR